MTYARIWSKKFQNDLPRLSFSRSERYKTKTPPSGHPACGLERCQLDACNTKKKRQSRVRIQFLAARALLLQEIDEERTCLLGGGAGRSPIDRVFGGLRERKIEKSKGDGSDYWSSYEPNVPNPPYSFPLV